MEPALPLDYALFLKIINFLIVIKKKKRRGIQRSVIFRKHWIKNN